MFNIFVWIDRSLPIYSVQILQVYTLNVNNLSDELAYTAAKVRGWYVSISAHQCVYNIMNKGILILQLNLSITDVWLAPCSIFTYNCLDHLDSLSPHVHDDLWYVDLLLFRGLAQSYVNGNECTCPTNSNTATEESISLLLMENALFASFAVIC